MSYNTRRGNIAFNKNVSSSSVGQRRPIVTNNYVQQQNQLTPRGQQPLHPSAQQQLDKQQQMLVQKKQQFAQHQRQQQQKQQILQQNKHLANKQQLEHLAQQKREAEIKKQRDVEIQKQKELEQQKQKELQEQKQKELQEQKQKELELQKEKELELQRQIKLEQEEQIKLEKEKQIKLHQQKQKEQEDQKRQELEKKKQMELELQRNSELEQLKKDEIKQDHQLSSEMDISQDEKPEVMIVEDQELTPAVLNENEVSEKVAGNNSERKKWSVRRKLSKYEIQRRRNFRLGKLLQPKNAMIVLNEVVKNVTYTLDDSQNVENSLYRATALVDGIEHEGFATTKAAAKNIAAEKALKYLVKHKKLMQAPNPICSAPNPVCSTPNQAGTEPMDPTEKEEKDMPLAWQQFASFAVYKLLASWGEDPNSIKEDTKVNKKPSKKIPENAHLMHPLMLLNQMMPLVRFEELSRSANGHNFTYTFKCTVDGQTFVGNGTSKKIAKKQAAFEVCRTILGIEYPPEMYVAPVPTTA
ncbi:hypothetical protein WA026_018745 [Henosepilachna vigintioctopunctata]|uniref:DRBM domain-containing protein n=1 Tax=Henosepilachna vigintioctopunctata TaxID=420089 RepID=A0AAW1TVH3_9CUCU